MDAWGKLSSGILSGHFYEFGAFTQCFDIERNGKTYETQYCLAEILVQETNVTKKTPRVIIPQ